MIMELMEKIEKIEYELLIDHARPRLDLIEDRLSNIEPHSDW